MNILRWNSLLMLTGSMLWYLAGGVLLYLLIAPVKTAPQSSDSVRRSAVKNTAVPKELPPVAEFAAVWHRPLQRPVFDAPPPAAVQEVKPEPPRVNARLVATAVDGGVPTAMFRLPSGKFVTLKTGDTFDNEPGTARITAVDGKQVTLQFDGFDEHTILGVGK